MSTGDNVALVWGEGDEEKFRVGEILRWARLPSESVVYIDSIVTTVMFERIFSTMPGPSRRIKMLSEHAVDENLDEDNQLHMEQLYQAYRRRFETMGEAAWAAWFMATTADLASKLWDGFGVLRRCERKDTLQWVLRAYSLLFLKYSDVKLKLTSIGMKKEFGVEASRKFCKGEYIYELVGLVPIDGLAWHTELSVIVPHIDQGEASEPRVLFGPIRFINHHCKQHNVEYIPLKDSCGFVVQVIQPIEEGEELFSNYGPNWFEKGECHCSSCEKQTGGAC